MVHMRLFIFVLFFSILSATCYATETVSPDDKRKFFTVPDGDIPDTIENRAKFSVSMFDQVCVKPASPEDSLQLAQEFMTELPDDDADKKIFMESVSVKTARVFYISVSAGVQPLNNGAHVYGGNAALVFEPNGRCHIVSSGADGDAMLSEMQDYAKGANEALKVQGIEVTYRERQNTQPGVRKAWVIFDFPNDTHLLIQASGIEPKGDEVSVMISSIYYGPAHGRKAKDLKF